MTANEFNAECQKRLIDPSLALENDDIRQALKDRDDATILTLLDQEF